MEIAKSDLLIQNLLSQIKTQKNLLQANIQNLATNASSNPYLVEIARENNKKSAEKNNQTKKQIKALKCLNDYLSDVKKTNLSTKHIIDEVDIDLKDINSKLTTLESELKEIHSINPVAKIN